MTQVPESATPGGPPRAALVIADTEGVICFWSDEAEALTGHSAAAIVGHSLDILVPPDYRPRHWAGFRAAMISGVSRFEGASARIPLLSADGTVRRWPGRFTLIRDARGRPAGAAAVFVPPADDDPPLVEL